MQIVRYMSFGKFLDFLTNGLAIPKASCFDDKWEGLIYFSHLEKFNSAENVFTWNASIDWIYVSCWHAATEECDAMWKLYGRSDTAVAIETSKEKIEHAVLAEHPDTLIQSESVKYRGAGCTRPGDASLEGISGTAEQSWVWNVDNLFYKHSAFAFEKEFRIAVVDSQKVNVSDLRTLHKSNSREILRLKPDRNLGFLEKVTVSPSAPPDMIEVVRAALARHQLQVPVIPSTLTYPSSVRFG